MRITTAICIVTMILANPGITVFADEMTEVADTDSETVEATHEDAAESAESADSATVSSEDTDPEAESTEDKDSRDDSSDSLKSEDKDDLNSEDAESLETEPDAEEDLVGDGIFPGGFEVDPSNTAELNAIASGVQVQSGITAASVTSEFFTGSYRLGSLPQFYNTTVDGVYLGGSQCYGYANMFLYKITGHTRDTNTYTVAQESLTSAARLKEILAASKAGAHIRIESVPHSMVFLLSEDEGFYMLHWNYGVGQCSYTTYDGFVSKFEGREFYVEMPYDYPNDQTVSVGENVNAGFDSETGTLTFYSWGGTLSADWKNMLNMSLVFFWGVGDGWTIDGHTIEKITISEGSDVMYLPEDCSELFAYFNFLYSLDISKADMSNVRSMYWMFGHCTSLQTLDLGGFDTSNVTDMRGMFLACRSLQTLDVSGLDTSNVTDMSEMFDSCSNLQTLDLSGFDTSNVTDMSSMFWECSSLKTLDLSIFDTSNVKSMHYMFYRCNFQTLDLSGFDTSNVTDMAAMFQECRTLQTLDLSGIDTSNVTDMCHMFEECNNLRTLNLSGIDTSNVTYMFSMFLGCSSLQTLDLSGFDTSNVTSMSNMFKDCINLQELNISSFDMSNVTDPYDMLENCSNLLVLMTPVNVANTYSEIRLPCTFVDASGKYYDSLPAGLSESICLTRLCDVIEILSISDDFYGKNGTQASFHIEAEGSGTISYKWQYRTAGSASWKTPSQTSAKTADYVFNLKPSYDNIEVRCIVSDEAGNEIISETRKANVFAYTSQPKDATASVGEAVNFEVSAIGRGVTYQWYYKRPGSTWKKTTIAGSKTPVLPITAGTINDGTSYRCVITDELGNKITSAAGILTLANTSLQVTGISEDAYDVNGKSVTFHIDAVGNGGLTYQWQYKLAGESKWRTPGQASAKTADYVFMLRPSYDNIEVRCIVTDASGNCVTSDVRKANVFAITGQPEDAELAPGEQTTFAVEAVGKDLVYQWYYMRPEGNWKKVTVAGCNTASLAITANTKNDGTKFRCRITDGLGNVLLSAAATLTQA